MISWVQIPVKDLKRAARFYEEVFGASFFFETLNGKPHAVFTEDTYGRKALNGALVEFSDMEIGFGPRLFFDATRRFDPILDKVLIYGGQIKTPKTLIKMKKEGALAEIPRTYIDDETGYFAHFIDCEGNNMGLYGSY